MGPHTIRLTLHRNCFAMCFCFHCVISDVLVCNIAYRVSCSICFCTATVLVAWEDELVGLMFADAIMLTFISLKFNFDPFFISCSPYPRSWCRAAELVKKGSCLLHRCRKMHFELVSKYFNYAIYFWEKNERACFLFFFKYYFKYYLFLPS